MYAGTDISREHTASILREEMQIASLPQSSTPHSNHQGNFKSDINV